MKTHIGLASAYAALGALQGISPRRPPQGPHLCLKCGKVFAGRTALKQHTKDAHGKDLP